MLNPVHWRGVRYYSRTLLKPNQVNTEQEEQWHCGVFQIIGKILLGKGDTSSWGKSFHIEKLEIELKLWTVHDWSFFNQDKVPAQPF